MDDGSPIKLKISINETEVCYLTALAHLFLIWCFFSYHVTINYTTNNFQFSNQRLSNYWFVQDFYFLQGTAKIDFTGTGHEVWGNINAPRAVTLSALIYCLRCMVGHDVPLNQVRPYESFFRTIFLIKTSYVEINGLLFSNNGKFDVIFSKQ